MSEKRKDNKGRILRTGESQRKDGRYQYRFQTKIGKRKVIYAVTLNELREKEKLVAKDLDDNINIDGSKMTLNQLFDTFMGLKNNIKETTRLNYVGIWNYNIRASFIGDMQLSKIRKIDIMKLYSFLQEKGLSFNTIKYVDVILSQTLQIAAESDYIRKSPAQNCIKEFSGDKKTRYSLTVSQQNSLIDFVLSSNTYKMRLPMITFMLGTGCRVGEMAGLSWSKNVDMKERIIHIDHQLIYKKFGDNTQFYISSPKSNSGVRNIPMTDEVFHALLRQKENNMMKGNFCNVSIDGYDDFVFTTNNGTPLSPAAVNFALNNIVNAFNKYETSKAQKERREANLLPHVSSHILRHTACTRMAESGIDIKILQYIMGHSNISTTMNIYNHIDDVRIKGEMKKFNGVIIANGVNVV